MRNKDIRNKPTFMYSENNTICFMSSCISLAFAYWLLAGQYDPAQLQFAIFALISDIFCGRKRSAVFGVIAACAGGI